MTYSNSSDDIWNNQCQKWDRLSHIYPATQRIIAIGDLHGDLSVTIKILKYAKIIDEKYNWIAEPPNTIVVQVGDQLDSCRPSNIIKCGKNGDYKKNRKGDLFIFKFLYNINERAKKKGGKVINLLGNHELMNVEGDFRFQSKNDIKSVIALSNLYNNNINYQYDLRKLLFKPGGDIARFMACTRQSAVIIGSNLFVHAGIVPDLAKKYKIHDINTIIRKWLLNIINIENDKRNIGSVKDILRNINQSPFWVRIFGMIPKDIDIDNEDCKKYLQPTLKLYDVSNMIVGHTPTLINGNKLNSTCDKHLWRIDVGLSDSFYKSKKFKTQFIEILNDNKFNIYEINNNRCQKIN